jgi:hypothetical protein
MLTKWMDFLGHLEGEKMFNGVLGSEEMSIDMDRKARVFELLEFQNCSSELPCFWSADLSEMYVNEVEFIRVRRFSKRKRLTDFQAQLFTK